MPTVFAIVYSPYSSIFYSFFLLLDRVIECSELAVVNGSCHPYILVELGNGKEKHEQKRTKTKKKTDSPLFDETFHFQVCVLTNLLNLLLAMGWAWKRIFVSPDLVACFSSCVVVDIILIFTFILLCLWFFQ